jgi:IS30 family transposase
MAASYHHITQLERCHIEALLATGKHQSDIAVTLGRSESAISRELRRNRDNQGCYIADKAHQSSVTRRHDASSVCTKLTSEMRKNLTEKLGSGWSPEQMSGRLKLEGATISLQTIYNFVWQDKKSGGKLFLNLRHQGNRYNKKSSKTAGRGCIPNRVDISKRPEIVATKSRIGDWEGDLVIGAQHKGALVTLVDKSSKLTLIKKIPGKKSEDTKNAIIELLRELPHPIHSITLDNGKEFSQHETISKLLKTQCYFATPYHSWERGLNEHTNGLIRQYLPKTKSFDDVTDDFISEIQDRLNHRPRKSLNFRTPYEVFYGNLLLTDCLALHF